jgi:hypothetical protein
MTNEPEMSEAELEAVMEPWFYAEMEELVRKGATPEDFREPCFADLLTKLVMEKHWHETTEAMRKALAVKAIANASSDDLREWSKKSRAKGWNDCASDLEWLADERDREGFSDEPSD